jgi:hypothetical protein
VPGIGGARRESFWTNRRQRLLFHQRTGKPASDG